MKGFTFLELLVTLGIAMLIFTGIVAGYNQFTDTTRIRQVALTFKNDLRLAQNRAITGEKPMNLQCDQLLGYEVTFTVTDDATSYKVQALCNPPQDNATVTEVKLPKNITFFPRPQSILFKVLTQGVNIDAPITFTLVSGSRKYDVQMNPEGVVSDVGFQ